MSQDRKTPPVNFIRHIDLFFEIARISQAINYSHIALYVSLFRAWNHSFFNNPMTPSRDDLMAYAGIKSKECYYRILRELSSLDLLRYYPSKSKYEAGLFCMSSLEWVDSAIKITVWSISDHQSLCGKQLQLSLDDISQNAKVTSKPHKLNLINGRGLLMIEKYVTIDFVYSNSSHNFNVDTTNYQNPSQNKNISSSFKNDYHANAKSSQQRHSGLHPSGVQVDPDADYSIPL